jgi:hypothetical protein
VKQIARLALASLLFCAAPALGGSQCDCGDGDGVIDYLDNCSEVYNPGQDDTDGDGCGNLCDADYDNNGTPGFPDFGEFTRAFSTNDEEKCHNEPIPGCTVGFPDFGFFAANFSVTPGPSGTTVGTIACP